MEYTLDKLDDAIFYYLSTKPNTPLSFYQIFDGLCRDKVVPDLLLQHNRDINKLKFTASCCILDSKFNNIYKYPYDKTIYLMFSTKSKLECLQMLDSFVGATRAIKKPDDDTKFYDIDYCELVDFSLKNPQYSPTLNFKELIDGKNTILHLVCINKRQDLLTKLLDNYNIDTSIKNFSGKTPVDILMEQNNIVMVLELLHYNHKKELLEEQVKNLELKKFNTQVVETCTNTTFNNLNTINTLRNNINTLQENNGFATFICILLLILNLAQFLTR
jgi:hypothetical protein